MTLFVALFVLSLGSFDISVDVGVFVMGLSKSLLFCHYVKIEGFWSKEGTDSKLGAMETIKIKKFKQSRTE